MDGWYYKYCQPSKETKECGYLSESATETELIHHSKRALADEVDVKQRIKLYPSEKIMKKDLPKGLLYSALFVLYLLHNDFWLWNDASLILGVPIGLFYHFGFCIAASLLFISIVKNFWPTHLEVETEEEMQ